jgi:hypothetical protein
VSTLIPHADTQCRKPQDLHILCFISTEFLLVPADERPLVLTKSKIMYNAGRVLASSKANKEIRPPL